MKKYFIYCLISVFILSFSSCKKYAEGPSFTLLTKKQRIATTWKLNTYYENNVDKTTDAKNIFKDFSLTLDKNNMKYSKTFTALSVLPYGETGSWKFSSDQSAIEFTPENTTVVAPYTWKIIKLKAKEWGVTYTSNNVEVKVYFQS